MMILAPLLRISFLAVLLTFLFAAYATMGQTETGTISGLITDETGAAVPGAQVQLLNVQRGTTSDGKTNSAGIYIFSGVEPGMYQIRVQKTGFKQVDLLSLIVNVQDHIEQNVRLQIGSVSESVTVNANDVHMNTTDASVSTVVDRQFAENLPLNGRSFQTLIQLTPGVVLTPSTQFDSGQFSVNGQRASSNYWMVDGVGANIGVSSTFSPGNGFAGALGSFSAVGGTNSLVSVDALEEFRILTSTYAPEFGRTPGGQISIVTRAGTNRLHGTLFEYFRNDALDANDWFADRQGLPKPEERQNDFGGTLSGPILRDRTFFFFSYEGLRLRLPQTALTEVPDLAARQAAMPALQPYLNAFPLPSPNTPDDVADGIAQFNASFSNRAALDAYSLRIDHKLNGGLSLFGRYNYSPSELVQRGIQGGSLNTVATSNIATQTATVGATWIGSPSLGNDLRLNYSRTSANSVYRLDNFGGAVPLASAPFPSPFTTGDSTFILGMFSLSQGTIFDGKNLGNLQRQINVVDNLSLQRRSHNLKLGLDFRWLLPVYSPQAYGQVAFFNDVPSAEIGNLSFGETVSGIPAHVLFRNFGIFAQDTWRVSPRLTLTYGLRWDADFAPSTTSGPSFSAAVSFNDLANLALAPSGSPAFKTPYGNVAPRLGVAYQVSRNPEWGAVLRGGFGVFYDLATSEAGNAFQLSYPFGGLNLIFGGNFPLDSATAAPPPIAPDNLASGTFAAFNPHIQLPYTLQWNIAVEEALGRQQTLSASYIGSVGRRLIQTAIINSPNPNLGQADLITNAGTSDYDALQLQFKRRVSLGLQVLASYTWSHSIDTASAGSYGNPSNTLLPTIDPKANRGSSDFDIRHALSAGITYDVPAPKVNRFASSILAGWSAQSIVQSRSATPVGVFDGKFSFAFNGLTQIRPDVVPETPFYLYGPQYPGGKAFNPAAFLAPPLDSHGKALRQGSLGRNALRGFGATQWDLAVHRDFPLHELLKLQFRAEMFNVLNHPNFGSPGADINKLSQFGESNQILAQSLGGANLGGGGFGALYQIGGPRSIQLALKLLF